MPETVSTKLENGRAANAFEKVKAQENNGSAQDYKRFVKKMPMMIQTNGLGHTLAFYYSKNGAHRQVYNDLKEWCAHSMDSISNDGELIEQIVNLDSEYYKWVTLEILAYLNWMRRFVEGMIDGESGGSNAGD